MGRYTGRGIWIGLPPSPCGFRKRDEGGWEVIRFSSKRNAEDAYDRRTQSPSGGTSGGVSAATPGTLTTAAGSHAFAGVRVGDNSPGTPAKNHTLYSINLLPIGGFVRMPGENGDVNDPDGNYDPQSFAAKSAGKPITVLVPGVTMKVILAIVLFTIAYRPGEATFPTALGKILAGSP